jgi:predicted metal-dependent peptidase
VLRRFVTQAIGGERTWNPPSRRHIHRGLYLPATRQHRLRAVVAIDTSGSVHEFIPQFVAELSGLLASFGRYELDIVWCDCEVQRVDHWSDAAPPDIARLEIIEGGGTDFRPVFDHVETHGAAPDVLIYLTDGYGPAPDDPPGYPVLWALADGCSAPARWGEVVSLGAD